MTNRRVVDAAAFDLSHLLRDGDTVVCGQACAEPRTLTRQLVEHACVSSFSLSVFVGTLFSDTFDNAPANIRFLSYGAVGRASVIADRGALEVYPESYSQLPMLFETEQVSADVVLLQVAVDHRGVPSFGLGCDYILEAARRARVVVAEVNEGTPWTYGTPWPDDLRVDHWILAELPPLVLPTAKLDTVATAIAAHVASIISEGATLQVGVGSLPDATLGALSSHRHLGFHSGVLGDAGIGLIQRGAIDNSRKGSDEGISVTNTLCGSQETYLFADRNKSIEVRHSSMTHDSHHLGLLSKFHAINGALEVDLSGQVNCEELQGQKRGGIGGLLDFSRAARASKGGRSITVLPATAAGGTISRIVATLDSRPVTIGRADVDTVVTEYGVAELRNVTTAERALRLISIAAPQHRDELAKQLRVRQKGKA